MNLALMSNWQIW